MLELSHLSVVRDGRTVLSDISCTIPTGSFVSIIGPNGAGKTTLLKAIAGILPSQNGSIVIDGHPYSSFSRRNLAKKISYLPQRIDTPYPFSVSDFILLSRYPYRQRWSGSSVRDHEIVHSLIVRFNLGHIAEKRLDKISGGELQRTLIAGALAQEASYVLLDEPTASLDPLQEELLFSVLEEVRRKDSISVVVSTHNLSRAQQSEVCIALRSGTVVHAGDTALLKTPHFIEKLYEASVS